METEIRHLVASKIKQLRHEKGLTQAQLADSSQIKYKYVQEIEGKNPPNIRVDTLARIAEALETPVWKILQK